MKRSFLLCVVAFSLFAPAARADFRVYEENAPRLTPDPLAPIEEEEVEEEELPPEEPPPPIDPGVPPDGTVPPDGVDPALQPPNDESLVPVEEADLPPEEELEPEAPAPAPHEAPRPFLDDHRWLDITGFLQPGFIARFENRAEGISAGITDDTFWLQRARIGLRAQVFSWLRMRFELEMTPVVQLQDAYLDLVAGDWLQVRMGQFIVPFLQTFRFNELNTGFLDRALYVPQRPDREFIRYLQPRDVGFMISGRIGDLAPTAQMPVFEYQLGGFVGRGPNIALNDDGVFLWAARFQLYALGLPQGFDRENDLARNHLPRATVGFAAYSNCDDRQNWNRGFTADVEFRWEGLFVEGAFVWMRNSASGPTRAAMMGNPAAFQGGFFLADSSDCAGQPSGAPVSPEGYDGRLDFVSRGANVQIQYVLPRFLTDVPFSWMDLELLARFDWVDPNSPYDAGDPLFGGGPQSPGYLTPGSYSDADNAPTRWRLTFGLNFYPTGQNQLRLGINYQLNRETENVVNGTGTYAGVSNDILWLQITAGL